MKKIVVNHGIRKELMKIFNVTYPTVSRALNFETESDLAKKIRKGAINKGGILFEN